MNIHLNQGPRLQQLMKQSSGSPVHIGVGLSEAELIRFLDGYVKHEILEKPKGRKTGAALFYAMAMKAKGKAKPVDRMSDSKVATVDVHLEQDLIRIQKNKEGQFEVVNYGDRFEVALKDFFARVLTPIQRRRLEQMAKYLRIGIELKRRALNEALAYQAKFLKSGDVLDIRPILQTELAEKAGIHNSSVSRMLQGAVFYYNRRRIKAIQLVPGHRYNHIVLSETIRRVLRQHSNRDQPLSMRKVTAIINEKYPTKFYQQKGKGVPGKLARRTLSKFHKSARAPHGRK